MQYEALNVTYVSHVLFTIPDTNIRLVYEYYICHICNCHITQLLRKGCIKCAREDWREFSITYVVTFDAD